MRILLFCAKFNRPGQGHYLTNELAAALGRQGHSVQVIALEWDKRSGKPSRLKCDPGVSALLIPSRSIGRVGSLVYRLSKWVLSPVFAIPAVRRELKRSRFELIIAFAPLTTMHAPLCWALRHKASRSYAYITDFFPFHHRSLGLLPSGVILSLAKWAESALVRRIDVIGCMSPANRNYLVKHYPLRPSQSVDILPLWGPISRLPKHNRAEVRCRFGLPTDRPILLFGGQITYGRGIEVILETAAIPDTNGVDPLFLFVGEGHLTSLVCSQAIRTPNRVKYIRPLPRDEYLVLAAACDIGLIVTVPNVDVPTFPSKTIDYLRAGLPIIASVESSTDYGDFIHENGIGIAVEAGNTGALWRAISYLLSDPASAFKMQNAGDKVLREVFDVDRAASRLLNQAFPVNDVRFKTDHSC